MRKFLMTMVAMSGLGSLIACGGASGGKPQLVATHLSVVAQSRAVAGTGFQFTVTALDASNSTVTAYSGTVRFTSTDPQASLPANSTLTNGTGTFSTTLVTPGAQTITATDAASASIKGTSLSIQVNSLPVLSITSGPPPNGAVGMDYGAPHGNLCSIHHNCFYYFQLTASENGGNWTWAAARGSSLPPGLGCCWFTSETTFPGPVGPVTLHPVIFGTPTAAGSYKVTVTVSFSPNSQVSANYTIVISNGSANATDAAPTHISTQHHH